MIRVILTHYVTRRDHYGNRYHKTNIAFTKTGKNYDLESEHYQNTYQDVKQLFDLDNHEIQETFVENLKIREFNQIECKFASVFELVSWLSQSTLVYPNKDDDLEEKYEALKLNYEKLSKLYEDEQTAHQITKQLLEEASP